LTADTGFFEENFTNRLLATTNDITGGIGGALFESENFQALALIQAYYRDKIDCIYIYPQYNTDAAAIIYKNDYKHSSWLSLIENRISFSLQSTRKRGIVCMVIDDEELSEARQLLDIHSIVLDPALESHMLQWLKRRFWG